jgi:hypothetical protein
MASLCLAFQLSDEVLRTSGAMQMDSLFTDEAFGTLDSDSRGASRRRAPIVFVVAGSGVSHYRSPRAAIIGDRTWAYRSEGIADTNVQWIRPPTSGVMDAKRRSA